MGPVGKVWCLRLLSFLSFRSVRDTAEHYQYLLACLCMLHVVCILLAMKTLLDVRQAGQDFSMWTLQKLAVGTLTLQHVRNQSNWLQMCWICLLHHCKHICKDVSHLAVQRNHQGDQRKQHAMQLTRLLFLTRSLVSAMLHMTPK